MHAFALCGHSRLPPFTQLGSDNGFNCCNFCLPITSRQIENQAFSLLQSCKSFAHLTQVHAHVIRHSIHHSNFVIAKLVSCCFSSRFPVYAVRVFDQMPQPNTFLWNALIKGLVELDSHQEALTFYSRMLNYGSEPNHFTFPFTLKACSKLLAVEEGKALHGQILKLGLGSDIYIQTSLVDFYGSCSEIRAARYVFDRMPVRDVVSWNAMIAAYVQCGLIEVGKELFEETPVRNVSSWTIMIGGFVRSGNSSEALTFFRQMQMDGLKPDKKMIVAVLSAVSDLGALDMGKWVHDFVKRNGMEINDFISTALIDMYAKCGSIKDAKMVFDGLNSKTISCYNAMIMGLAIHGLSKEAVLVFREAERMGVGIDDVTIIAVLSACRHCGLVEEGCRIFQSMEENYGVGAKMEHYKCLLDLLGRAGKFDEAMHILESIEVDSVVLGTLAFACWIHGNVRLGEKLIKRMSKLDESDIGLLLLKSNIYAAEGRWEEAAKVRKLIKDQEIQKHPGYSWIEVNNAVHRFVAADHSHPYSEEIYSILAKLSEHMILPLPEDA